MHAFDDVFTNNNYSNYIYTEVTFILDLKYNISMPCMHAHASASNTYIHFTENNVLCACCNNYN